MKRYILFLSVFVFLNCFTVKLVGQSITSKNEDFTEFFNRFSVDRNFQFSRIVFPIKIIQTDDGSKTTKFIARKNWKFTDLKALSIKNKKVRLKQMQIKSDEINIQYSISDTGILVNHYFKKTNGEWWLIYVNDESD